MRRKLYPKGFTLRTCLKFSKNHRFVPAPYIDYYGGGAHFEKSVVVYNDSNWQKYKKLSRYYRNRKFGLPISCRHIPRRLDSHLHAK